MKLRGEGNGGFMVLAIVVVLILAGVINFNAPQTQSSFGDNTQTGTSSQSSGNVGYATTIQAGGMNSITGAAVDVNSEIFSNDRSFSVAEVQTNSQPESLSTSAPNSMAGYLMIGNDHDQSATDRGTEVYYRKIPFSYQNKGVYQIPDTDNGILIDLYDESTPTWTGYDDGTAESTTNITVGSGATVTSIELKIAAGSDACLGNPSVDHPLAVCFNVSTSSDWDEIRPASYVGTFEPCDSLSSRNIKGDCYILPTDEVCDYEEYRFSVVADAAAGVNPDESDNAWAFLLDKTWYKNEQNEWELGWCDDSVEGTDLDPGIAAIGNSKVIWFN